MDLKSDKYIEYRRQDYLKKYLNNRLIYFKNIIK